MGKLVLITGGCRSGKSHFAQSYVEEISENKVFLATCPKIDREMDERIEKHKKDREGLGWRTVEEDLDLVSAIKGIKGDILIDCLTLWVNNLLYHNPNLTESEMKNKVCEIAELVQRRDGLCVFVSNEVGLGLVPADSTSRLYRDLVGRCNQTFAQFADEVHFMVSGINMQCKPRINHTKN